MVCTDIHCVCVLLAEKRSSYDVPLAVVISIAAVIVIAILIAMVVKRRKLNNNRNKVSMVGPAVQSEVVRHKCTPNNTG